MLATTACSTYLDARAEAALRDALLRVVGPAESYDVRVSGASLDGSRFERVRFVGRRIARAVRARHNAAGHGYNFAILAFLPSPQHAQTGRPSRLRMPAR
jgi:hypothetical protein